MQKLCFNQLSVAQKELTEGKHLEEEVKNLILRDLMNLKWDINLVDNKIEVKPPDTYTKDIIKEAMSFKRNEIIAKNRDWINKHSYLLADNLADGYQILDSKIKPVIEVCENKYQNNLFRILRYYWSSPYSEYVGRRIKIIIRDYALPNKPVIGLAALGSPIIHIPERDEYIGWDKNTRTKNIIYTMDAYVIGAIPPYNLLLGGKLISYILSSNEIRKLYYEKYKDKITLIEKRKCAKLVGIFTTSLYGRSSQYNRLKYKDDTLYKRIGETKGYGTMHLSEETINKMQELLKANNIHITNKFGDGPSWTMRVIRGAGDLLGFDSEFLLKHSFKRSIYFVPLSHNCEDFLTEKTRKNEFKNYSMNELVKFWKERWLNNRKNNLRITNEVRAFRRMYFKIT